MLSELKLVELQESYRCRFFAAMKYGKAVIRDENGNRSRLCSRKTVPYGNNDDNTDKIAAEIVKIFMNKVRKQKLTEMQFLHNLFYHYFKRSLR